MASEAPRYVVDASTVIKWHLEDEEHVAEATALLADFYNGRVSLLAPDNIRHEVPGSLRKAVVRGRIDAQSGREAIEAFLSLPLPTVRSNSLVLLAYDWSLRYGCSYYDGVYVALAQTARCPLILADRRLFNALAGHFSWALWIGDYPPLPR